MTATPATTDLFDPVRIGALELANRIVMAPLTRSRASSDGVPNDLHVEYYRQRASAGLIITEATNISMQGRGYAYTPGIYTYEQVAAWARVVEAVHARGGRIVMQLWHVGRISHPSLQPGGGLPVAPSAIGAGGQTFTEAGMQPVPVPRALETDEIPGIVEQYRVAARNARAAGFDGVEVHAANGYLLEQFFRDSTNTRTDAYGGPIENRIRLALEATDAVVEVWGAERTGIRVSPVTPANNAGLDSDTMATYGALIDALSARGLLYLHMVEGATGQSRAVPAGVDLDALRRRFDGPYMGNNLYTLEDGLQARRENTADLVCYGRPFIANPDLVERFRRNAPLAEAPHATFYGGGAEGYIDWPTLDAA